MVHGKGCINDQVLARPCELIHSQRRIPAYWVSSWSVMTKMFVQRAEMFRNHNICRIVTDCRVVSATYIKLIQLYIAYSRRHKLLTVTCHFYIYLGMRGGSTGVKLGQPWSENAVKCLLWIQAMSVGQATDCLHRTRSSSWVHDNNKPTHGSQSMPGQLLSSSDRKSKSIMPAVRYPFPIWYFVQAL